MFVYRLFLLIDALLMALPKSWRKRFFVSLASIAHYLAPKRNRVIQQNLAFAFGDQLEQREKDAIEKYCYRNLAINLLQTMENRRNNAQSIAPYITFKNREHVDAILSEGRGIIFVSAHFGNWELGAAAISSLITPTATIYKGFSRQEFDPYLFEARSNHRMKLVEKNGALKHLTKTLKNNGSISLMIDQASNAKYGIPIDFFSHKTYHSSTPAHLASKFNIPIVGVYIFSEDEEHYTIAFEDPIEVLRTDEEAIREATLKQVNALERIIKAHPNLWFWCHKRWKGEYKEIYEG